MEITKDEQARIAKIRKDLRKFERRGINTSTWEASFWLKILDRKVKDRRKSETKI